MGSLSLFHFDIFLVSFFSESVFPLNFSIHELLLQSVVLSLGLLCFFLKLFAKLIEFFKEVFVLDYQLIQFLLNFGLVSVQSSQLLLLLLYQ
jgi:hypothetical protein